MPTINVGVRYEPLGGGGANIEDNTTIKHWVLVFTGPGKGLRIEAGPSSSEADSELAILATSCSSSLDAYPLGTYHGEWSDFSTILGVHPQQGTAYSPCYNNGQHFVGAYLLFLNAFANRASGRAFHIHYSSRYTLITNTLTMSGMNAWNSPNSAMSTLNAAPITAAGALAGAALVASEATAATVVSAGGVAGWLGFTTTVVGPAAFAGVAAFVAPVAIAGAGVAGVLYLKKKSDWKNKTRFENPLIVGYPGFI